MQSLRGESEKTRNNKLLVKPHERVSTQETQNAICVLRLFQTNTVTTDFTHRACEQVLKKAGATLPLRDVYAVWIASVRYPKEKLVCEE